MKLVLVRHGETDSNKNGIIMGHLPTPLNELGREQATVLARELRSKGIQKIYSSDLVRAKETAEIISAELNLPVTYSYNFREHTIGDLDGKGVSEVLDSLDLLEEFDELMIKHNGEITRDFINRVWTGFNKAVEENRDKDCVLIVTHGGCIRSIIAKILQASEIVFDSLKMDNCCINVVEFAEKREKEIFSVELVNDVCHFSH